MTVTPLGSRILIRPDIPAPESDLIVAPDIASKQPEMSGTVIALGDGPEQAATLKRELMTNIRDLIEECAETFRMQDAAVFAMIRDELGRYGATRPTEYELKVGDRVLFPWNVGTKFILNGEDYITMREDDVSAVFEDDDAASEAA